MYSPAELVRQVGRVPTTIREAFRRPTIVERPDPYDCGRKSTELEMLLDFLVPVVGLAFIAGGFACLGLAARAWLAVS
jgi:hypothetical protein